MFDFRGDPKAILRGRVLGVVLLAAYHYAFGFSRTFGVTVIAVLLLALPFLLRSALRFRLHNTQYRGRHGEFTGSAAGAYLAYLPPMLAFLLHLGWPLMHGAMILFIAT